MRYAIGLCFMLLMTPGLSHAAGVGAGVTGGLSIPGDSRLFTCRCPIDRDLTSESVERFGGHVIFYGEQAGPEFGGEIFLKIDPVDIGLGGTTFFQAPNLRLPHLLPGTDGKSESGRLQEKIQHRTPLPSIPFPIQTLSHALSRRGPRHLSPPGKSAGSVFHG